MKVFYGLLLVAIWLSAVVLAGYLVSGWLAALILLCHPSLSITDDADKAKAKAIAKSYGQDEEKAG